MQKLMRYGLQLAVLISTLHAVGCERSPSEPEFDSTPVASLELVGVAPGIAPAIRVGETYQFMVVARDSSGNIVARPRLEWSLYPMAPTVDLGEATLDAGGSMTGVEQGWVTLRVSAAGGGVAATWVYIRNAVASVRFSADAIRMINGDRAQVSASAFDAASELIPYGVKPRWESSNPIVATVDSLGAIRSVSAGRTYIRVRAGERVDSLPIEVRTVRYRGVSPGDAHTCGVTSASEVVCEGRNEEGQLGFFTASQRFGSGGQYSRLADGGPRIVTGGTEMGAVTVGSQHSCSLGLDRAAYCWGNPLMLGAVGRAITCYFVVGTKPCVLEATRVAGDHDWTAVSAGPSHTCGVTAAFRAYCWGVNVGGQLGDGTRANAPSAPVPVAGSVAWQSIAASVAHTCGLSVDGSAHCWGLNTAGNLGTGRRDSSTTPSAVAGGQQFKAIAAGSYASCGLTTAGKVYCWGIGSFLGSTPPPDMCPRSPGDPFPCALQPVALALPSDVMMLTMGSSLACAVSADGATYCWGPSVLVPTRVQGIPAMRTIQAGGSRACGVADDAIAYCWGTNLTPSPAAGQY